MWYTVAKCEMTMNDGAHIMAGTVWTAESVSIKGCAIVKFTNVNEVASVGIVHLIKTSAPDFFTKPTRNLDAAMEESFMISEKVYG